MWSIKFLIIRSFIFLICYGQKSLNSIEILYTEHCLNNSVDINTKSTINRIVGGKPLDIGEVPYQVALFQNRYFVCGGSIISADWILTAAHCLKGGRKFQIRAGSKHLRRGGILRYARSAVFNSGYNSISSHHDIGLVRLTQRLRWSPHVKPVRLAKPNFKLPHEMLVSGWGSLKEITEQPSRILLGVTVTRVSYETCKKNYKYLNINIVTMLVFCASSPGRDACQGDSGGPLTNNGIQYGIVSFGFGCGRIHFPGVYTKVSAQIRWMKNVIQRFGGEMPQNL